MKSVLDINKDTETAGVYILHEQYFLFMFGFSATPHNNQLGIVRFGGHREQGETVEECLHREILEETNLNLHLFKNKKTYYQQNKTDDYKIFENSEDISPILVTDRPNNKLSTIYLGYGSGILKPCMETQGILLLTKENIEFICTAERSFAEYKSAGGKYIITDKLNKIEQSPDDYSLIPKTQLKFLNELFLLEPAIIEEFYNSYI